MMKKKIALILLTLLVLFNIATVANAAIYASEYINDYFAQIKRSGNKITVAFDISCKDTMDQIGAQTILIQERQADSTSWTTVATYSYTNYPDMLGQDDDYYRSSVYYYGAKDDCRYRAKVYYYAEKGGYDTAEYVTIIV